MSQIPTGWLMKKEGLLISQLATGNDSRGYTKPVQTYCYQRTLMVVWYNWSFCHPFSPLMSGPGLLYRTTGTSPRNIEWQWPHHRLNGFEFTHLFCWCPMLLKRLSKDWFGEIYLHSSERFVALFNISKPLSSENGQVMMPTKKNVSPSPNDPKSWRKSMTGEA